MARLKDSTIDDRKWYAMQQYVLSCQTLTECVRHYGLFSLEAESANKTVQKAYKRLKKAQKL